MYCEKYKRVAVLLVFLLLLNLTNRGHLIPEILKFQKVSSNYLTGLVGSNGPLLAVKIDDTKEAHPQIGISEADNVYVEQVESGLTRLLALYSSNYPDEIGPVRSARISDIDLLAQYGRVAFAYSGSQAKMRPSSCSSQFECTFSRTKSAGPFSVEMRPELHRLTLNTSSKFIN
jgi:hypothetical protein